MFDRVEVRRLCKLLHNSVPMVCKPLFSPLAPVLGVIVLLESDVEGGFVIMIKGLLRFIIQNGAVELCIHLPFNPSGISNAFLEHTAPHHAYHLMALPPLSTPISSHLTPDD
jgi:hypothetical protein